MRANRKIVLLALLTMSPAAAPVLGQVAPPPPQAPEKTPEYVPPAPTATPAPPPAARRPPPRNAANQPRNGAVGQGAPLPDVPYDSLVKVGDDKKIIRLTKPSEYAAIEVNPMTTGPIASAELAHLIHERQLRFEEVVIENLDLVLEVEGGFFRDVDWNDRANYAQVTQRVRPLAPPTTFNKEAQEREIMTRMQAQFNAKIAREYEVMVTAEARAAMSPDRPESTGEVMDTIMRLSISESLYAYGNLCDALAQNLEGVRQKLTLTTDEEVAFASANKSIVGLDTPEAKRAEAKELVAALSLDNGRAALRAARELRPEAVLPEIPPFEDPRVVMTDDPDVIAAMRAKQIEMQKEIDEDIASGRSAFVGNDGKMYFKNPDGSNREATPEEIALAKERANARTERNRGAMRKVADEVLARKLAEKMEAEAAKEGADKQDATKEGDAEGPK